MDGDNIITAIPFLANTFPTLQAKSRTHHVKDEPTDKGLSAGYAS
jgi:hypothetical protein